jgi:hypothetical protein
MPLKNQPALDITVDRGRVLPLGGPLESNAGFKLMEKAVDTPNAYNRFSRRTRISASKTNDSDLQARHGMMSAVGEVEYKGGKRALPPTQGQSSSYMNEPEPTPRKGKLMTGAEQRMIDDRIYAEDHPRKLTKAVAAPQRAATDAEGRSPFITANGLIGKFNVSPHLGQKNRGTTQDDLDTRNASARRALSASGAMPQRYASPFRAHAVHSEQSVVDPVSMPLHPEISKGGLAKVQRFAPSRRHEPSLTGVFTPAAAKAPPPYKLVAPFHTSS